MHILIIDGQGGKLGRQLVEKVMARKGVEDRVSAVGTNALATMHMLKANPDEAATGDNAVAVCARRADVICGPVGIVIADAMNGEVTAKAALAVGRADCRRVLVPVSRCETVVVGVKSGMGDLVDAAVEEIFRE